MAEWEIVSEFLTHGYKLYAPDGSLVGTYDSMDDARSVLRELQETAAGIGRVLDAEPDGLPWSRRIDERNPCTCRDGVFDRDCPRHGDVSL